jgi:hypothetical protein
MPAWSAPPPPRDIDEPRLWTLTDDTARFLNDMKPQAAYDEYLHLGCYAFFDSCANAAIGEGLDALSSDPPLSMEHAATITLIKAGQRNQRSDGGVRPYSIGLPPPH